MAVIPADGSALALGPPGKAHGGRERKADREGCVHVKPFREAKRDQFSF